MRDRRKEQKLAYQTAYDVEMARLAVERANKARKLAVAKRKPL